MTLLGRAAKRAIDVCVSASTLAVLLPLMGTIAAAVWLDSSGPVLFRQPRLGRGGRMFRLLKFRTMRVGAEVVIDSTGQVLNALDDDRHTRVGRLLRVSSLDELPQLVNVLAGHMSLVGPRPDLPEAVEYYSATDRDKLLVRPGMTGLAQVEGRNALTPREKWRLDAEYARTMSLVTDLRIVLRTIGLVARRSDVY
jgi:lipopolysaccharide/colanic/teichoic acid biosynthesis glycosyltransferase